VTLVEPFLGACALSATLPSAPHAFALPAPVQRAGGAGGFSPVASCGTAAAVCPVGNTGQNGGATSSQRALVDYCTSVFRVSELDEFFSENGVFTDAAIRAFVDAVYPDAGFVVGPVEAKFINYCPHSARILGPDGAPAGHFCISGDGSRVMIDLTGAGCRWVRDWHHVRAVLETFSARLTHVDCAIDDYTGELVSLGELKALAEAGAFKNEGAGAPPISSFHDDMGSNKGCSLYVGQRGHKQLNCYEKGKQLGDPNSDYVRVEVRLYGKHLKGKTLPFDVLTRPFEYVVGAYDVLAELFAAAETSRPKTVKAAVEATAEAAVRWLSDAAGPLLNLVQASFGGDALQFLIDRVNRDQVPRRFRGLGGGDDLTRLFREAFAGDGVAVAVGS
jgi:phage replication initiation protein